MLGDELRKMRVARGMNPTTLSRLSGISRTHLYAIERGENDHPYADTLNKLARGLASWRSEGPDESEAAAIFRELQEAAGYPVEAMPTEAERHGSPCIPDSLAEPLRQLIGNWYRWGQTERELAAQLVGVAANIGRHQSDTVVHNGPTDDLDQNTTTSVRKSRQKHLALSLDKPRWPLAEAAFAYRPGRLLATV